LTVDLDAVGLVAEAGEEEWTSLLDEDPMAVDLDGPGASQLEAEVGLGTSGVLENGCRTGGIQLDATGEVAGSEDCGRTVDAKR
jgi:hypothetical protein